MDVRQDGAERKVGTKAICCVKDLSSISQGLHLFPFQPSKNCPCQYQPKLGKTVQKDSKPVFRDDAEEDSHRSMKPSHQTIYPQSTLHGFSAIRAKQLVN